MPAAGAAPDPRVPVVVAASVVAAAGDSRPAGAADSVVAAPPRAAREPVGAPGFGGGSATLGPSRGGGGAGFGGAVFNMQGSVTVVNSTFVSNSATGGAPLDLPDPGKGMGGAVFNMSGSFVAVGSTFAQNSASDRGTTIYNLVYDALTERLAQVTLRDTIVARGTGAPEDLVSDETDYNLVPERGKADAAIGERNIVQTSAGREDGTITGTALTADPLLQTLASNGGFTQTMLPGAGSPALDAGSAFGLTTDQRGLAAALRPALDRELQRRLRYRRRRGAGPGTTRRSASPPAGPAGLRREDARHDPRRRSDPAPQPPARGREEPQQVRRHRQPLGPAALGEDPKQAAEHRGQGTGAAQTASPASHTPDTDPTRTGDPTPHRHRTGPGLQSAQGHTARHREAETTGPR